MCEDVFLGQSSTFWVGVEALGVCASGVVVLGTLWFIYRQVRVAAKSFQLDAICRLQELVDAFLEDRAVLFRDCPLDVVVSDDQFCGRPPARGRVDRAEDEEHLLKRALTAEQTVALQSMSEPLKDRGRRVIAKLNDIGQLVEDGFIDKHVFFSKYHVMVIQCCHLIEALRREEEARRGGNYGQRLLRLRHRAIVYNDIWPKHRSMPIRITRNVASRLVLVEDVREWAVVPERRLVYQSPAAGVWRRAMWALRRWLAWY
jgi:hypothetical protein